jgi:flagellar assembly protein FliH
MKNWSIEAAMLRAPAKYLFDQDFGAPKAATTVTLAEHQSRLAEAESRGYRNGFAAAEQEGTVASARLLAQALERIGQELETLARGLTGVEARLEAEAVDVAVAVAKKLAPELLARESFAEVAALVTDCFRQLIATPHVVVRINDKLYDQACEQLDKIAKRLGFDGRLVVLAEPDIAAGDCRIEWADGGVTRDAAKASDVINETVGRFLMARYTPVPGPMIEFAKGPSDE